MIPLVEPLSQCAKPRIPQEELDNGEQMVSNPTLTRASCRRMPRVLMLKPRRSTGAQTGLYRVWRAHRLYTSRMASRK